MATLTYPDLSDHPEAYASNNQSRSIVVGWTGDPVSLLSIRTLLVDILMMGDESSHVQRGRRELSVNSVPCVAAC